MSLKARNFFENCYFAIVGRAITIKRAIEQRSYESMYKTEAKRLRETTFAITELEKYVTFESSVLAEYTTAEHPLAIACPNSKSARLQFRASTF